MKDVKNRIIFICLFILTWFSLQAQNEKLRIAIFDPAISGSNFDEGTGVIIREMVSTVIVNSGKYTIIERSLIDKVLREQNFANSGAVDDSQISQIGKLAGANKVILSVLSSSGNRGLLSLKMIDVESANIESQKTQVVELTKILDIITPLALELIGEKSATPVSIQDNSNTSLTTSLQKPSDGERIVFFFPGYPTAKNNPIALIYMDSEQIGFGSLHQGFTLHFQDNNPGKHKFEIKWSDKRRSDIYNIDTKKNKDFTFQYEKYPFGGTILILKNEK